MPHKLHGHCPTGQTCKKCNYLFLNLRLMARRENYLKLRGSKREQAGENFIVRRVIICVTHRILLGQ